MKQKLAEGDTETALNWAEKLCHQNRSMRKPAMYCSAPAEMEDWGRRTSNAETRSSRQRSDAARCPSARDAVLCCPKAKTSSPKANSIEARESLDEANRLSPDLIPAARDGPRMGTSIRANRNTRPAWLKKAWSVQPHPDHCGAFRRESKPDETPKERLKPLTALTRVQPGPS